MDQIQNSMLQVMQAVAGRPAAPANRNPSGKDDFRKLMSEQQAANATAETPKEEAAPQDGETVEVMEDPRVREQMMLAAAAMLQTTVVTQVQDPVEPAAQTLPETAAVQLEAECAAQPAQAVAQAPESLAETVLPKVNADQTLTVRQGPVETVETVEAPAEVRETVETVPVAESSAETQEDGGQKRQLESGEETVVFQDVREVPVKVGEAPILEKPAQPVETQISEKLTEALKSGETRVEIQLAPENLGKVTIEVTMHQDGTLHVALHAESSQTRGLLERDLGALQSLLARNTQQEVQVEVQRHQESQRQNFYDGHQGQERQNPQQQHRQQRRESEEDFLHQLRLGLIPVEGETV